MIKYLFIRFLINKKMKNLIYFYIIDIADNLILKIIVNN